MMKRNMWLILSIVVVLLLGINNTIYYFITKSALEKSLSHEMRSLAKQIEISIEQSRLGAEKYQELLGHKLRAVSIAAQYALDPDIEKVDNAQLVELSERLEVLHITLLKRTADDIVLYKSSDPLQLGIKTSSWKPWYEAFNELFDRKQVSIDWGQSLTNFWTGPFEVATSDTSKVRKWGYYYDGTTNYIIDPYVSYDLQDEYEEITGVNKLIAQTLQENPSILEIAAFNPKTFVTGELRTKTDTGQDLEHITTKPILFGSYEYGAEEDAELLMQAFEYNEPVDLNVTINGKHVLKTFIPVPISKVASIVDDEGNPLDRYILTIVSDYRTIQDSLDRQFLHIGWLIGGISFLSIVVALFALRYFRKSRDRIAKDAQVTYVDEINQLFHTIQAQRHDFVNHVQTIHSLAALGKLPELKKYTNELSGEIQIVTKSINIGNPAFAALVQLKLSLAENYKIRMDHHFQGMSKLELGVKTLDLTKLIGNLVDNAIDEVAQYSEQQHRWISLSGSLEPHQLRFTVSNYIADSQHLRSLALFKPGYTSKQDGHSGLGLSIVKSIVQQYNGTIQLDLDIPNQVNFRIVIPH